jgi:5-methylcytosine-specific restriction endonuclease McrA
MVGKKPHAIYCTRKCKGLASSARRGKTTPEENKARYQREKERRKQYAVDKYWEDPEAGRQYSRTWRKSNPDKRHVQHHRRRARLQEAYVEDVDRNVVFKRDKMICQRCGIKCNPKAEWPAGNLPTLDHIIALANGGEHSYANAQTLCLSCNCRKGASE